VFCTLANAHVAAYRPGGAARALAADLPQQNRHFTVYLKPSGTAAQAGATCAVLDLALGALHLDLLLDSYIPHAHAARSASQVDRADGSTGLAKNSLIEIVVS
jgi:hypothetical protein